MKRKKPFYNIGLVGLGIVLVAIAMIIGKPSPEICANGEAINCVTMPDGFEYVNIVGALEFVTEVDDVHGMLGNLPEMERGKLDANLGIDYLFLGLYTVFLVGFCLQVTSTVHRNSYFFGALLAIVAGIFDVLENLKINEIVGTYEASASYAPDIFWLHIYAWAKWIALCLVFLILFFYFRKGFNIYQKLLGYFLGFVPLILGGLSYFFPQYFTVWFMNSVFLAFFVLIIYSLTFKKPNSNLRFF